MPWVTAGEAGNLYDFCPSLPVAHDTNEKVTNSPFYTATDAPDVALRRMLTGNCPEPVIDLLFCSLRDFHKADLPADDRITRVLELIRAGVVRAPKDWTPHIVEADGKSLAGRQVYTAFCLRVNILEALCRGMRAKQAEQAAGSPLTKLDACSYYCHLWLDAHLLFCIAIEAAGMCPSDGTFELTVLLDAYEPSAGMCFHEGQLPNLLDRIEACSFFGETSRTKDNLTYLFSKAVPHRCIVRDVIHIIETSCQQDRSIFFFFQSVIAASLLGTYRHVRNRPALAERLRLYHFFFFVPTPPVCTVIADARRNRGVSMPRAQAFRREFGGTGPAATEAEIRCEIMYTWLSAIHTRGNDAATAGKKRYLHQNTVVNVVREYLIFGLNWLPHVLDELCERTDWLTWQNTVISCLDAMRASAPNQHVLKDVNASLLPSKTLYQVEKMGFMQILAAECAKFLDSDADGGSDQPVDAIFTSEMDVVLRRMIAKYPPHIVDLQVVPEVPGPTATWAEVEERFLQKGKFPLRLLYGSKIVIREFRAASDTYNTTPSPALAGGFVRFLSKTSLYQLQLVQAFANACVDRSTIYAIPLPRHLAQKQVDVLRKRLNAHEGPCPSHVLTTFVCRICRKFRGALSSSEDMDLPPFGSELVSFSTTSLESYKGKLPTWQSLLQEATKHKSLFAWYKANSSIDGDLHPYPPDPSVFSATPDDLQVARTWYQKAVVDFDAITFAPDPAGLPPVHVPQLPVLKGFRPEQVTEEAANALSEDDFRAFWNFQIGKRPIIGHASTDPEDRSVIWTCASKYHKREERRTNQVMAAQLKVQDAITERQRESAQRTANVKRRHDMRFYHKFSLCSKARCWQVNMLGWAVRIDKTMYVGCCGCLGYGSMEDMHYHGDSLLCTGCWKKTTAGHGVNVGVIGSGTTIKCKQCKRLKRPDEEYFSTTVLADQSMRFVQIYFCERDMRKKSWLFSSPNYQSMATVELGIKADWGSLKQWDPRRDYLQLLMTGSMDVQNDKQLLKQVRKYMGDTTIDGDGEGDGEEADEIEELLDEAAATLPKKTPVEPIKARKTGLMRGKAGSALKNA